MTDGVALVDEVARAADAVDAGDDEAARRILGDICAGPDTTVEARLARLFAAGLLARLDAGTSGGGNLYLADLDDGVDMIGAFDTRWFRTRRSSALRTQPPTRLSPRSPPPARSISST